MLRNRLETLHQKYRDIFHQVEEEIDSQLCGIPLRAYPVTLKSRLKRVVDEYSKIYEKNRNACKCAGCGMCCNFAVSEFSYEDLKQKAENGDVFASQFVSVFIPYEKKEDYENLFPEYIELLDGSGDYYVYHCPKVTNDNRCPDYENRPQICRDFPDNPLAFLPKTCSYASWKLKTEQLCLKLRAEKEIISYLLSN